MRLGYLGEDVSVLCVYLCFIHKVYIIPKMYRYTHSTLTNLQYTSGIKNSWGSPEINHVLKVN